MTDYQIAAWCIGYGVLLALVCVSQCWHGAKK